MTSRYGSRDHVFLLFVFDRSFFRGKASLFFLSFSTLHSLHHHSNARLCYQLGRRGRRRRSAPDLHRRQRHHHHHRIQNQRGWQESQGINLESTRKKTFNQPLLRGSYLSSIQQIQSRERPATKNDKHSTKRRRHDTKELLLFSTKQNDYDV